MQRSKLVPIVLALLVVGASGCLGSGGNGTTAESTTEASSGDAQRIVERANETMQSVDTYRTRMVVEVSSGGQTATNVAEMVVNRSAGKTRMTMTVTAGDGSEQHVQMYMDAQNETMYTKQGDTWQSQPIPEEYLYNQSQLSQMQDMMASGSVSLGGTDTVNGTSVQVIEIDPDEQAFMGLIEQQVGEVPDSVSVSELSMRQYVDTDANLTRKVTMRMVMESGDQTMSVSMRMLYLDFGVDTDIQLPEEATRAAAS